MGALNQCGSKKLLRSAKHKAEGSTSPFCAAVTPSAVVVLLQPWTFWEQAEGQRPFQLAHLQPEKEGFCLWPLKSSYWVKGSFR